MQLPPPCLPIPDSLAARLTQWFDGVLRSFLLFGAAARHQRGDGEGVGPGRKLGLGRCRELHGPQCAVLARDRACRTAVQLPPKRQRPKHSAKFPSAARGQTPKHMHLACFLLTLHWLPCEPKESHSQSQSQRPGGITEVWEWGRGRFVTIFTMHQ